MPETARAKRFFGSELRKLREGKPRKTKMTEEQLIEAIHSPTKAAVKKPKKK